jgi:hypothetical protein
MGGAVTPLPQYAFMAWCSVRGSRGTTLPLPLTRLQWHCLKYEFQNGSSVHMKMEKKTRTKKDDQDESI